MKNLNTILLLLTGILYLSACEAKCREKNTSKFKRSLKLAISSDDINIRHKVGLRKIFRRKREIKDEDEIEGDKFTAEIKFLQKWNPAMNVKDGSAYRLFQGNVLDAVLEQLNADRRFLNSHVLDLKKTPGGILAKVGFHFRRSEHNPISHIRFIVSRGHLSSLKVDKHYFKILKISAKFTNENDKIKPAEASSQQKQSNNEQKSPVSKQEAKQTSVVQQALNEPPPATAGSQTQPESKTSDQAQNKPLAEQPSRPQNEASSSTTTHVSVQSQATSDQNQHESPATQTQIPQDQNAPQVASQQQTPAAGQAQNSFQSQNNVQAPQYPSSQAQAAAPIQQDTSTQVQNVAAYQPAAEQTTANPSNNANTDKTQNNDKPKVDNQMQPNSKPQESTVTTQVSSQQENQKSASLTEDNEEQNVSIKMNQAWFPFLSNHDSLQYKMLAGNFEKGLKSVMEDDKNIKDIKVTDLLQGDQGHTEVKLLLKFNADKDGSTGKLRKIVKTGDIAGISVDATFFKMENKKKA